VRPSYHRRIMAPKPPSQRDRRTRVAGGIAAFATVVTLTGSVRAEAAPGSAYEIERLYLAGQDRYAARDFAGAAEEWTELLRLLPENEKNREIRENVLINVLQSHLDAYRRLRNDDGSRDVEHLHAAKRLFDAYVEDYRTTYGEEALLAAAVRDKGDEVDAALAEAAFEEPPPSCLAPCLGPYIGPCLEPLPPPPMRRGCGGERDDLALLGVLALPGIVRRRRKDVFAGLASRLPADVAERLRAKLAAEPDEDQD
jgi:hypothetical protein